MGDDGGNDQSDSRADDTDDEFKPQYRRLYQRLFEIARGGSLRDIVAAFPTPGRSDAFPGVPLEREDALTPDRLLALAFLLALFAGLFLALGYRQWLPDGPLVGVTVTAVYVFLWLFVGIYVLATGIWILEAVIAWRYDPPDPVYGYDEIQVRVLTIDAEEVVQQTVDALPDGLAVDVHVVAEQPIEIDGATVNVVPETFECAATDKGRALEWARREIPCEREFVLFLDEDTLVREFDGLPDVGVAQFKEWPMFTGSYWAYWAEILRVGYQLELAAFSKFSVPLYAWGGGIAVRTDVENEITWNFETLIEDTVFAWKAAKAGHEYAVLDTKFRNQAPPSVSAMIQQRRRWVTGSLADESALPLWYRILYVLRNVAWAFSPVSLFLVVFATALPATVPGWDIFYPLTLGLFACTFMWVARGWRYYDGPSLRSLPLLPLLPFVVAAHSAGAALGFLSPADDFETTEKE